MRLQVRSRGPGTRKDLSGPSPSPILQMRRRLQRGKAVDSTRPPPSAGTQFLPLCLRTVQLGAGVPRRGRGGDADCEGEGHLAGHFAGQGAVVLCILCPGRTESAAS